MVRGISKGIAIMEIETPEQLRREIAYRRDERIGIMTNGALPSKAVVEFAENEAREWARKHYPELYACL